MSNLTTMDAEQMLQFSRDSRRARGEDAAAKRGHASRKDVYSVLALLQTRQMTALAALADGGADRSSVDTRLAAINLAEAQVRNEVSAVTWSRYSNWRDTDRGGRSKSKASLREQQEIDELLAKLGLRATSPPT